MVWCNVVAVVSRVRRIVVEWEHICNPFGCLHWNGNTKIDEFHHFCPVCQPPLWGIHTSEGKRGIRQQCLGVGLLV